jgi:hypothetical protein
MRPQLFSQLLDMRLRVAPLPAQREGERQQPGFGPPSYCLRRDPQTGRGLLSTQEALPLSDMLMNLDAMSAVILLLPFIAMNSTIVLIRLCHLVLIGLHYS